MSYPSYTAAGLFNPCFLYMDQLKRCFQEKIYPQTSCNNQKEDFIQCHSRHKHNKSFSQAQKALDLSTGINVPHYDAKTDSFIYDDGKVISNEDPVFKTYTWF